MPSLLQSPEPSQKLTQLKKDLQLADREWKKLLKGKDKLSTKELSLFRQLTKTRTKVHSQITKMELESRLISRILKDLGVAY